jgi:hypothetical protein
MGAGDHHQEKRIMKVVVIVALIFMTACVRRSIQIDSTPRGALVVMDEVKVGYTPLTIPFSHYGVRKIRIEKMGYVKKTLIKEIIRPWYEAPFMGFVSDVLWPWTIEDIHPIQVTLQLLDARDDEGLMERAMEARNLLNKEREKKKEGES